MQTSVLQDFLNLRLLNIGADDSRLEKLGEACDELAQQYAAAPIVAMAPLLAAWDPTAGPDPTLVAIGELLQKHWPTFRGAFQDEPLTLYRAIVLEAVMRAMEQQGTMAVAVSLVGANVLPHLHVGQEERILSKISERAQSVTSERLTALWPTQPEPAPVAPLKSPAPPALKNTESNAWFPQVAAAAGPGTNKQGVSLNNPNPHWSNQASHWSYEFADRMAPILADVHDKAANAALKASAQALKALGDSVASKLNDFLRSEQARSNQLNTSSRLLWWRQALYSETAAAPYRKLEAPLVALHMAFDIADLLPEVYPPAVESLLFEAVRAATGAQGEEQFAMSELLDTQRQSARIAASEWLQEQQTPSGSRSLLVQALATSCAAGKAELPQLGVDLSTKMALGDWAIWLLREVKALEALSSPDEVEQPKEQA
ncbi:GTPase-associated system all-helical protein GASH [Thauera phenylacetica]|uniref:GTPase-associated system all-helical protein GASH n=1 Tax=Thauera phenylacetica TaxID=164400 RepID=UPI0039E359DE